MKTRATFEDSRQIGRREVQLLPFAHEFGARVGYAGASGVSILRCEAEFSCAMLMAMLQPFLTALAQAGF